WSSDMCSSDLGDGAPEGVARLPLHPGTVMKKSFGEANQWAIAHFLFPANFLRLQVVEDRRCHSTRLTCVRLQNGSPLRWGSKWLIWSTTAAARDGYCGSSLRRTLNTGVLSSSKRQARPRTGRLRRPIGTG